MIPGSQARERIATERVEHWAAHFGVTLERTSTFGRSFALGERVLKVQPRGKGTYLVRSYVEGVVDCEVICGVSRVADLLRQANNNQKEQA